MPGEYEGRIEGVARRVRKQDRAASPESQGVGSMICALGVRGWGRGELARIAKFLDWSNEKLEMTLKTLSLCLSFVSVLYPVATAHPDHGRLHIRRGRRFTGTPSPQTKEVRAAERGMERGWEPFHAAAGA